VRASLAMPTFLAVRCYSCSTFQVIQRTKQTRWTCKLCHEKQSLQRAYATSWAARDARAVVQQLNLARGMASQDAIASFGNAQWSDGEGQCGPHDQSDSVSGAGPEYSLALNDRRSAGDAADWHGADRPSAWRSDWRDDRTRTYPAACSQRYPQADLPFTASGTDAWNNVTPVDVTSMDALAGRSAALCGEPGRPFSRWAKYASLSPAGEQLSGCAVDENELLLPQSLPSHRPHPTHSPRNASYPPASHAFRPPTTHASWPLDERAGPTRETSSVPPAQTHEWSIGPIHVAAGPLQPPVWLPAVGGRGSQGCGSIGSFGSSAQNSVRVGGGRGKKSNPTESDRAWLGDNDSDNIIV